MEFEDWDPYEEECEYDDLAMFKKHQLKVKEIKKEQIFTKDTTELKQWLTENSFYNEDGSTSQVFQANLNKYIRLIQGDNYEMAEIKAKERMQSNK